MSKSYHGLAFNREVLDAQRRYGSRRALARMDGPDAAELLDLAGEEGVARDPLTADEREFIGLRDGFYLATASEAGWPYVQFRGGPPGFVGTPDEHTIAWPEFRGNRQYITTGNLHQNTRVAIIFMDYAGQFRLKVFGRATVVEGEAATPTSLQGYRARVERQVRVDVAAYDWNCPQHIAPRFSLDEVRSLVAQLQRQLDAAEAEKERLRRALAAHPPSRKG